MLSAVFPIVILALPVGYYVDKRGFRRAVLLGSAFFAVFGVLRVFATTFLLLLIFQTLAAAGQPFIFNSISKLVKRWFPADEAGLATGLGSISLFIGTILGLSLTPVLTVTLGFEKMLLTYGVAAFIVLFLFFILGKEAETEVFEEEYRLKEYVDVLKNRNVFILSIIAFIGVGIFTAYLTWVEPVLEDHGLDVETAGLTASTLLFGGIFGSILIPALSDRVGKRRPFLFVCFALSAVLFYIHTLTFGVIMLAVVLFILGFFFISALPLALDLSATSVGEKYAGTANSSLWLLSQVGSVLLIVGFESMARAMSWDSTLILSAALLGLSFLLTIFLRE